MWSAVVCEVQGSSSTLRARLLLQKTVDCLSLITGQQLSQVSKENRPMQTFSSSSFFSDKFLRFRAVSSRRRAISASLRGFFLREVSATQCRDGIMKL